MSGLLDRIVGKNGEAINTKHIQYIKAIPLRAYEDIDVIKADGTRDKVILEVSGGVNEDNVRAYA